MANETRQTGRERLINLLAEKAEGVKIKQMMWQKLNKNFQLEVLPKTQNSQMKNDCCNIYFFFGVDNSSNLC